LRRERTPPKKLQTRPDTSGGLDVRKIRFVREAKVCAALAISRCGAASVEGNDSLLARCYCRRVAVGQDLHECDDVGFLGGCEVQVAEFVGVDIVGHFRSRPRLDVAGVVEVGDFLKALEETIVAECLNKLGVGAPIRVTQGGHLVLAPLRHIDGFGVAGGFQEAAEAGVMEAEKMRARAVCLM